MSSLILFFLLTVTVTVKCLPVNLTSPSAICHSDECHKLSRILHSHLNESVDPCDDWYLFACGKFGEQNPLRDGQSSLDALALISVANDRRSETLLDDVNLVKHGSKIVRKMKKLYDECLNNSDENIASSLRKRLFTTLIRRRDNLIDQLKNVSTLVRVKLPTTESIGHSVETMGDREVCRQNVQYEYDYAFSRVFIEKYNNQGSTQVVRDIIDSVHRALERKVNISTLDRNETILYREELAKLEKNLVYPDWVLDDHELDSEYGFDQVESLKDFIRAKEAHPYWPMPIIMVNAVFSPNQITVPAGILQDLVFNPKVPPAVNYGSAGFISGHEMSHAVKYYLRYSQNILEPLECIQDQLTTIVEPQSGLSYDTGAFLISETLADVGGINASLFALRDSKRSNLRLPGKMSKYSPEQLFFISNANTWCHHSTRESVESNMEFPFGHPFNYHRTVLPVLNSPDFSSAFQCPTGSRMNPINKCRLW